MSTQQLMKDVDAIAKELGTLHLDGISEKERVRLATPCFGAIRTLLKSDLGYMVCGSEYVLQCKESRRLHYKQLDVACQFAWTGQTPADLEFWDTRLTENVERFNDSGKSKDYTKLESMIKIFKDSPLGPHYLGPHRVPETNVYLKYLFYEDYLGPDYTDEELDKAMKAPYPALYEFISEIRSQSENYHYGSKPDHHPSTGWVEGGGTLDAVAIWVDHNYNDDVFRKRYNAPEGAQAAVLAKRIKIPTTNKSENHPSVPPVLPDRIITPMRAKWRPLKLYRFNEAIACVEYIKEQIEKKKEQIV